MRSCLLWHSQRMAPERRQYHGRVTRDTQVASLQKDKSRCRDWLSFTFRRAFLGHASDLRHTCPVLQCNALQCCECVEAAWRHVCRRLAGWLTSGLRLEGTGTALARDSFRDVKLPEGEILRQRASPRLRIWRFHLPLSQSTPVRLAHHPDLHGGHPSLRYPRCKSEHQICQS